MAELGDWISAPLTPGFGVRLAHFDLRMLDLSDVPALLRLVVKHRILLFSNQDLDPIRQVSLTKLFGPAEPHHPHPSQIAGLPEVFRVASMPGDGHVGLGQYWHADGLISPSPPALMVLRIVQPAERGGETCFLDAAAAFRTLPRVVQAQLNAMTWQHTGGGEFPFIRRHAATGDLTLMVNFGRMGPTDRWSAATVALLRELVEHCDRQQVYEHVWSRGDVIIADNLAILHRANPVEPGVRRVLDRTIALAVDWPVCHAVKKAEGVPWM